MTIYYGVNMLATGANIRQLRRKKGLSVRDIQEAMGFDSPSAVYKWEWGKALPSIEHLMTLSWLFDMRMEDILIWSHPPPEEELFVRHVNICDEQLG